MSMITLVCGFKFPVSIFDNLLSANRLPTIGGGYQPCPQEAEAIARLFREDWNPLPEC